MNSTPCGSAALLLVHHQDAGGDAGAVEQVGRQADDRFEPAVLDECSRGSFSSPPRNSTPCGMTVAMRAVALEHRQHVLDEHQVGLLALFRHP